MYLFFKSGWKDVLISCRQTRFSRSWWPRGLRRPLGIAGSNPARGMDVSLLFLCCVVLCR
jgi:hypothetical protein